MAKRKAVRVVKRKLTWEESLKLRPYGIMAAAVQCGGESEPEDYYTPRVTALQLVIPPA